MVTAPQGDPVIMQGTNYSNASSSRRLGNFQNQDESHSSSKKSKKSRRNDDKLATQELEIGVQDDENVAGASDRFRQNADPDKADFD